MKETKIDWCDCTVNPIVGCKRGCPYCYARRINDRFHFVKNWEQPETKESKLKPLSNSLPLSVFADSMSDPEYWTNEQTSKVIEWMNKSSNDYFILLTKSPKTINSIRERADASELFKKGRQRLFLGYSCGSNALIAKASSEVRTLKADFLSIEPLEEPITRLDIFFFIACACFQCLKLIIIGAETGNRKGKVECQKDWVEHIVEAADYDSLLKSVFMKESLREIMGADFRQDKLPWPCRKQNEIVSKEGKL